MQDIYSAIAVQTDPWACQGRSDVKRNLDRILEMVDSAAIYHYAQFNSPGLEYERGRGPFAPVKLVALPELTLNLPRRLDQATVKDMIRDLAITIPGPETDALAAMCKKHGYFLACGAYEAHEAFPGRIFNSAFLIDPKGEVILVHRKYNTWIPSECMPTSPHDVFDKYREVFGKGKSLIQTFFPVVDTEIGRIGMITCNDGLYPENWRALGLQGAEVILHGNIPEPFGSSPYDWRYLLGRTNAVYQTAYVVSPAWAMKQNHPTPAFSSGGGNGSFIVDPEGRIMSNCGGFGESMTSAVINLDYLRRRRADPGSFTFLTHLRTEAYREMYQQEIYPANVLAKEPLVTGRDVHRRDVQRLGVVDKLVERGVLKTARTDGAK